MSPFYRPDATNPLLNLITNSVFGFISSFSLFPRGRFITQLTLCSPKEWSFDPMSQANDDQAVLVGEEHFCVTRVGTR